ncbi:MAG: hypothetical protein AAGG68_18725 [Bacteroidota bacterium]
MFRSISFFVFLIFIISDLTAQNQLSTDTIPFRFTAHNNIVIQSIINQKDTVNLMFHTASDLLTLTEEATAKMSTLQFNAPDSINSWGGKGKARFSEGNLLEIGNLKWKNIELLENKNSGPGTDGKFGLSFFEGRIIEINFNLSVIVLHDVLPKLEKEYEQFKLFGSGVFLFLEGKSNIENVELNHQFLIHTGYGGTILYDDEFAKEHNLGEQLKTLSEKELKDAYGNILKVKKSELPFFSIGKTTFEKIPIGFFEGKIGRQRMSVIGGDLIKRFNLILDKKNSHIYLKTNQLTDSEFSAI